MAIATFRILIALLLICSFLTAGRLDQPFKVGEFADICCEEEKALLDNFTAVLRQNPDAKGYIIFYGGQSYSSCQYSGTRPGNHRPRRGEAEARAERLKPYLTANRKLDAARIVVENGGLRKSWMAELWIVPVGAQPPAPSPTLQPKDIIYRKGKVAIREFHRQCEE